MQFGHLFLPLLISNGCNLNPLSWQNVTTPKPYCCLTSLHRQQKIALYPTRAWQQTRMGDSISVSDSRKERLKSVNHVGPIQTERSSYVVKSR